MRLLLVIFCLLAIGLPALAIDLLPEDAILSKLVTLDLKGESLSDIAKVLSKATGVNVRASADVSDQKATVLVGNMPLRDVMNGLATLYGWSWAVKHEDDKEVYVIYDPLRTKREADRKEALDKAWKALAAQLDSLSFEGEDSGDHYKTLALLQYRALSPKVREAFLSGMLVRFDTDSTTLDWQTSEEVMDNFSVHENRTQGGKMIVDGKEVNLDPIPPRLTIELSSAVGKNAITAQAVVKSTLRYANTGSASMTVFGGKDKIVFCTQEIPYPSDMLENILPNKPADDLLGKKVSVNISDLVAEGAYSNPNGACFATRTDILAALHKELGLQVISDYYSSWSAFKDTGDITVKQLLEEKQFPGFPADWGWDGKVFYMRVKDIRTADSREIPNRLLKPWQAVVKKQGYRGLDELAEAALLSDEQTQALSDNCHYLKLGDCKEIEGYWCGGSDSQNALLRFYGKLTRKQKTDIFAGGVGVMELTQEQLGALAALIYKHGPYSNDIRVGIFSKDGLNMDEPQIIRSGSGDPAVVVRMTGGYPTYAYQGPNSGIFLPPLSATTAEEALAEAQEVFSKDFDPRNVVSENKISYMLTVSYEGYEGSEQTPRFGGSCMSKDHASYHRLLISYP